MANKKEDKKDPRYNWIHICKTCKSHVRYIKQLRTCRNQRGWLLF